MATFSFPTLYYLLKKPYFCIEIKKLKTNKIMANNVFLDELINSFVGKFGYDTIVKIESIPMNSVQIGMFDRDTPYICAIKVNSETADVPGLQFFIDFWNYGWTDDKTNTWYKDRESILSQYGHRVLSNYRVKKT